MTRAWIALMIAALLVLIAIGSLAARVARSDRERSAGETLRLALWRLDARATALLVAEAVRPATQWRSYTDLGGGMVPSPLLQAPEAPIAIHVELDVGNHLTSPQAPVGRWRTLSLGDGLNERDLIAAEQRLQTLTTAGLAASLSALRPTLPQPGCVTQPTATKPPDVQAGSVGSDYASRAANSVYSQAKSANQAPVMMPGDPVGAMTASWAGAYLILARSTGSGVVQAAVIDQALLGRDFLATIADLLPVARLEPSLQADQSEGRLAALPMRLVADGPLPQLSSGAVFSIALAWTAALLGLTGAATLLAIAHRLAERRATFVSAVTHELRTPLTALRLHTDLLADPRVGGDAQRRSETAQVLRGEAQRLSRLVDNVLDYARLERRRPPEPRSVTLADVLTPMLAHLAARVDEAGMTFTSAPVPAVQVRCDPAAVERILTNLVDNAAKYAAGEDHRVELSAVIARQGVELHLRDHGPGLAADARATLFTPFARSSEAAAGSAPGVGLGLALCRRLARAQGGEVRLDQPSEGSGVDAVLVLPLA